MGRKIPQKAPPIPKRNPSRLPGEKQAITLALILVGNSSLLGGKYD